ncbi:MAG: glycosyl transferase [Proteobacteria bacterium]|nr:MAG: glycosyl transferase [Pseudomonadota bacterium]
MKVLQVLPGLENGGVERGTLEIASALVLDGHESWVISSGGKLVSQLEAGGSHHKEWDIGKKSPLTLLQVRKLRQWLQQQQFDIIHVRSRMPAWITWLAWRKLPDQIRQHSHLVSTMHGLHSVSKYSEIMTCGERVIAVSKTCQHYITRNYPATRQEKIRLIYRGVDDREFPYGYQADTNWQGQWYEHYPALRQAFVIALPGRLTRLKGHNEFLTLIAALKNMYPKNRCPPIKGLIVGGEDPKRKNYAREIYQRVAELGLKDDIIFTGHRPDMKEIYSVVDVVLSLSAKPESFGRTVLEALAIGTPVIGYDRGGVGEILCALYPSGRCEVNRPAQVQEKLQELYEGNHPEVRRNTLFLLSEMQNRTLALYQSLATRPAGS